ncbi:MAG: hypothetical protein JSW00_03945 [Thermoplasmata archaeon]|nr:MAG: hypothetical protein JSW00_03945 [Thermoplasmata archaeon]
MKNRIGKNSAFLRKSALTLAMLLAGWTLLGGIGGGTMVTTEEAKLTASDGATMDQYGVTVALEGDTAVVGAWGDDDLGNESGAAYVYTRAGTTWTEQAKLTASDGGPDMAFGHAVSLSGDTLLVGSPGDIFGATYVFERSGTTWIEQAKMDIGTGINSFGFSVALDGDTAVIGDPIDYVTTGPHGRVFVYLRSGTTWTQQAMLTASDGQAGDNFGIKVALSGDTILVAANDVDDLGSDAGAAYVYERSGGAWTETQKLYAGDGDAGDHFGTGLSIDGDTAIIGAFFDDPMGTQSGSAYAFERSGGVWSEQQKLMASDGANNHYFGGRISLEGDRAVITSNGAPPGGAGYIFERSGGIWSEQQKLTASDGVPGDLLGFSASLSGDTVLLGAIRSDGLATDSGAAYVFTLTTTLDATIDINPDTLNLKSKGKWITGYIELPNGYDVNDIIVGTVKLNDVIPADWGNVEGDRLMVKFDRGDVQDLLGPGTYNLKVTGELTGGIFFEGYSDEITVINPP